MHQTVILRSLSKFYSYLDEQAFFQWLGEITAVKRVQGENTSLLIELEVPINDTSLREFIALVTRYGATKQDTEQLTSLCTYENEGWFKDPDKYWYAEIFGKST